MCAEKKREFKCVTKIAVNMQREKGVVRERFLCMVDCIVLKKILN